MALEPVGVSYTSENFNRFLSDLAKAGQVTATLTNLQGNLAYKLNQTSDEMAKNAKITQSFLNVHKSGAKILGDVTNQLDKSDKKINQILANMGKTVLKAAEIGVAIGGAVGAIIASPIGVALGIPTFGLGTAATEAIAALAGAILGALVGAQVAIMKGVYDLMVATAEAIGGFFGKLGAGIIKFVGTTVSAIYQAGKQIVNAFASIVKNIYNSVKSLIDKVLSFFTGGQVSGIRGGWRGLSDSIFGAMIKFEVLKQTARAIIGEIKSLGQASFDSAVEVQTLTARLDNLIAMQIRQEDATLDYGQSMQLASKQTQDLLHWVQELALSSPISVEDVSKTVSLAIAMGWSVDSAKTLTKAILDYTSATGLSSDVTERIIFNFAQMKNAGKVTGTELRDLARGAFMPINDILKIMYKDMKDTTMSFEQFRDLAATGEVDVNKFFDAFVEFVDVNMPDAAYRMNYTFAAVKNNIQDLFKILLGWNVFGPMIKSITEPLQRLIERFKSDDVLLGANRIGKAMAFAITAIRTGIGSIISAIGRLFTTAGIIAPTIENVVKTIVKFSLAIQNVGNMIARFIDKYLSPFASMIKSNFGDTFNSMRKDFFTWGGDMIVSFAEGMMKAASKFLIAAINYIAKILTYWFKASVPNILPNIGIWGMDTINEWLHGFTEADFGILDSLKGAVKDALDALSEYGILSDVQATQMYADLSVELIRAVAEFNKTGKITTDIFGELMNIGGAFGREIAELLDMQLQLAVATERTVDAQKAYDDAVKAAQKSELKTNRLIKEYNALVRKGYDRKLLKDKLKIVNASEIELSAAKKAEIVRKEELTIAQEQQKALEDMVKLQETLIKQLTDLVQAQNDASGAAKEAAEALEAAVGAGGGGWDWDNPVDDWDLTTWMADAQKEFDDWWNSRTEHVGNLWYELFVNPNSDFQKALDNVAPSFQRIINSMKLIWDDFAKSVNLPSWDEISKAWDSVSDISVPVENLDPFAPGQGGGPDRRALKNVPDWVGKFKAVIDKFAEDIKANGGILNTLMGIGSYLWEKVYNGIYNSLTDPNSTFRTKLASIADDVMRILNQAILGGQPTSWEDEGGRPDVGEDSSIMGRLLSSITGWIATNGGKITQAGKDFAGPLIEGVWQGVTDKINEKFKETIEGSPFGPIIKTLYKITGIDLSTPLGTVGESDAGKSVGGSIVQSINNGIVTNMTPLLSTGGSIYKAFKDLIDLAKTIFYFGKEMDSINPFHKIGASIVTAMKNGINSLKDSFIAVVQGLFSSIKIPDWLQFLLTGKMPSAPTNNEAKSSTKENTEEPKGSEASGGSVKAKQTYLVGERGSELFVPKVNGFIIPNGITTSMMKSLQSYTHSQVSAPPVYGGNTVNFGDVHINNNMDWAMFKAQVHRAIVEG